MSDIQDLPTPPEKPAASDTRQRILQAAAQVFGELGYARATTRGIAAAAQVTEVTLFRHFGSKEKLFIEVVQQYGGPAVSALIEQMLTGDLHQDLIAIGGLYLNVILERSEILTMMFCEATHFPEVRQVIAQNPRLLRQTLAKYFQRQMEAGVLRQMHPEAMAQAFGGMFFAYAISLELLQEAVEPEMALEGVVSQFVDIFIHGTMKA
jgi:AcrR family transcriptional regulator